MAEPGNAGEKKGNGGSLGRRFDWKPVSAAQPAQAAVERLATPGAAPAVSPPAVVPATGAAATVAPAGPDRVPDALLAQLDELKAQAGHLRLWTVLAGLACVMIVVAWVGAGR